MSSHITVLPASTQAGKETIRFLLQSEQKPFVRGLYRNIDKAPAEFTSFSNFQAVQGDIATGKGLDCTDSDAVLYIPPPTWDGTDQAEFAHKTATFVANALKKSPSVRRLVIQSALGAQHDPEKIVSLDWSKNHDTAVAEHISRAHSSSITSRTIFSEMQHRKSSSSGLVTIFMFGKRP